MFALSATNAPTTLPPPEITTVAEGAMIWPIQSAVPEMVILCAIGQVPSAFWVPLGWTKSVLAARFAPALLYELPLVVMSLSTIQVTFVFAAWLTTPLPEVVYFPFTQITM